MNVEVQKALPPNFETNESKINNDAAYKAAEMKRVLDRKAMANLWRLFIYLGFLFLVFTAITVCLGITSVVFSYIIRNQD